METTSGKPVHILDDDVAHHKDYTSNDHYDAGALHNYAWGQTKNPKLKKYHLKWMNYHVNKGYELKKQEKISKGENMNTRDKLLDWMSKSFTEGGEGTAPLRPKKVGGKFLSTKEKKSTKPVVKRGGKFKQKIKAPSSAKVWGGKFLSTKPIQKSRDALSDWLSKAKGTVKTSSGKNVHVGTFKDPASYKNFTHQDHIDAAAIHWHHSLNHENEAKSEMHDGLGYGHLQIAKKMGEVPHHLYEGKGIGRNLMDHGAKLTKKGKISKSIFLSKAKKKMKRHLV